MRSIIDNWRDDYNHHRPHNTLGYIPPATLRSPRVAASAGGTAPTTAFTTMQTLDL